MRIYGRGVAFKLDGVRYSRALDEMIQREFKKALYAFLEVAEHRIPVETGMARGSLQLLADFAGFKLDLSDARPRGGNDADVGASLGNLRVDFRWPNYGFTFTTDVYHYWLHETQSSIFNVAADRYVKNKKWESFKYGRKAFKDYLTHNIVKNIPKLDKFVTRVDLPIR